MNADAALVAPDKSDTFTVEDIITLRHPLLPELGVEKTRLLVETELLFSLHRLNDRVTLNNAFTRLTYVAIGVAGVGVLV